MKKQNSNSAKETKYKSVNVRFSHQDHQLLCQLAESANMNVSNYVRKSVLSGERIYVVAHGKDMLPHLTQLSNYVNQIEDQSLKHEMQKEVQALWQYLSM